MSLIQGIGAAAGLLQGAASMVREMKGSSQPDASFKSVLQTQLTPDQQRAQALAQLNVSTGNFIQLRDVDQDGMLRLDESGLSRDVFTQLDTDKDGLLSADELAAPARNALNQHFAAATAAMGNQ